MTPSGTVVPRQTTGSSDPKKAEALRQSLLLQVKSDDVNGLPVAGEFLGPVVLLQCDFHLTSITLGQ